MSGGCGLRAAEAIGMPDAEPARPEGADRG